MFGIDFGVIPKTSGSNVTSTKGTAVTVVPALRRSEAALLSGGREGHVAGLQDDDRVGLTFTA